MRSHVARLCDSLERTNRRRQTGISVNLLTFQVKITTDLNLTLVIHKSIGTASVTGFAVSEPPSRDMGFG